jgi:hypothetical protein
MSDRPFNKTSYLTRRKHSQETNIRAPMRKTNPQFQHAIDRRPSPDAARTVGSARLKLLGQTICQILFLFVSEIVFSSCFQCNCLQDFAEDPYLLLVDCCYYALNGVECNLSLNLSISYRTRHVLSVVTLKRHWNISWINLTHFIFYFRYSLTLSSYICLHLTSGVFHSNLFYQTGLCVSQPSCICLKLRPSTSTDQDV